MNIKLNPDVLRWARQRAGLTKASLAKKVLGQKGTAADVNQWEKTGEVALRWVEIIADKTQTAFGYLFLNARPNEALPINDFRTVTNATVLKPSADLFDVLYKAQVRQNWYREYLVACGGTPLPFVGEASVKDPPEQTAANIRRVLGIGPNLTTTVGKWEAAFKIMIEAVESGGILFLRAGYAGGYTARKLNVKEFRGFAISDEYAPLIFINGADAPNAQMFTLAHELAHIWLGVSGISNLDKTYSDGGKVESYCNQVAAEVLLPISEIRVSWQSSRDYREEIDRLSRKYKVSQIVIARRAHDAGFLDENLYNSFFIREIKLRRKSTGGDYYTNEQYQNSKRFSVAVLSEAKEGRTLFHDAMQLLGIKKRETFSRYMESLQMEAT